MSPPNQSEPAGPPADPMGLLFAAYVLNTIGQQPADKEATLRELAPKLQSALQTRASDWKGIVAEALHLSQTIDIAILDLWYRNRDAFAARGEHVDPEVFAHGFVTEFLREGSQIDRWPPGALEEARARIARERV